MNKKVLALLLLLSTTLIFPVPSFAREGICGYEGGISSGEESGASGQAVAMEYQEVSFVSGEPIVFKGDLTIKKNYRRDKLTETYTYNLRNTEKDGVLTRVLVFETETSTKENGQVTETANLTSARETLRIGGVTYTIPNRSNYEFTRSNLIDPKPAVEYHAGSIWSKKVYQVGAAANGDTVTVECTGRYYGYDQYWGSAESLILDYSIISEKSGSGNNVPDKWGGNATVVISSTSTEQLEYQKNKPDQISFSGNYMQSRMNSSILEYTCMLPEFDAKGISTDNVITYKDSLKIETFPAQKSLPAVNTANFRGHWAENEINIMFGLEVFKGNALNFNPDQYMSRAEFAAALVQVAREVPEDSLLNAKKSTTSGKATSSRKTKETVISPFADVSTEDPYFAQIKSAFDRGLINGKSGNLFKPNEGITRADAIVTFIRALGFEALAPSPAAVTAFRDNDLIPGYARNAIFVAQKIGLVKGDSRGNVNPNKKLTKAEAAVMLNSFINYLQNGMRKDYRERFVNY